MQQHYSHAATVLHVKDVSKTLEYYSEKLGFGVSFKWEDPPSYAVLKAGEVNIHLAQAPPNFKVDSSQTPIYIFVRDIERLYQKLKKHKVEIVTPLSPRDYGQKDFDIRDPNGYILSFSENL